MTPWDSFKAGKIRAGAGAIEFYVAWSSPAHEPPDNLAEIRLEHLDYQKRLETDGSLVFAGPVSDDSGKTPSGGGLIVYRAESYEQALAIAEGDPMHQSGARNFDLRRWLVNEGRLDLSLRLSTLPRSAFR